jgi:hypothetical protein
VTVWRKIGAMQDDVDRVYKRLQGKSRRIYLIDEAGSCGYEQYRQLVDNGFTIGHSTKAKRRVKTAARRNQTGRSLRAGDLSAVHVSTVEDDAFHEDTLLS